MKYCSINGKKITTVEVSDRSVNYGDGLFTTALIKNGQVVLLSEHLTRLINGCKQLKLHCPDKDFLVAEITEAAARFPLGVLKVIISAGSGGRGYSRIGLSDDATNVIVMVFDYPSHYQQQKHTGISLGLSQQKLAISPMLAGIKHLNRLEQVLLRAELDDCEEDDLLVLNAFDEVIEATSANFFYWLNGMLCTPSLTNSGVDGLMRQFIIKQAGHVTVQKTTLAMLENADAMFISNCVMGLTPIHTFCGTPLSIALPTKLQITISESL